MNNKALRLFSLVILIPTLAGCVRVPAKSKPSDANKMILVDVSIKGQAAFSST